MSVHFKAEDSPFRCIHCNVTFASKIRLDEHIIRKHPNFSSSVTSKLHECTKCTFKTVIKSYLDKHLLKHPEIASNFKLSICIHCNATFKSKTSLDDHVVKKHPDFSSSITSKLHECTKCTFKTVKKDCFDKHSLKHLGLNSDFKHSTCVHCNATFKSKKSLDYHVVAKHPDFISSVTNKLHECTKCTFKTTSKCSFDKHLLKHPGLASDFRHSICVHCNATFKSKTSLDDHVIRKHPDFISSIVSKLHECTKCTFKTTVKSSFNKHHFREHPEVASNFKLSVCIHCNATFKSKKSLDYHVVAKHPDFISSVTNKLHECTKCTFKTVIKSYLDKHLLKHPEIASDFRHSICVHCNATFKSKTSLDDHVIRKHPDFISSIVSKLHECTKCTFKTTSKCSFDKHLLKHPGLASDFRHSICVHCNATFKSKTSLDDHVIRKHPDFISSIVSKLHECTKCTFKTTVKSSFNKHHFREHSEVASNFKLSVCIHCNATFKSKTSLDDHVIRKHPDFILSITSKLHECTKCHFKTVRKRSLNRHLLEHPEVASNFKLSVCINCNTTFKSKKSLDHHVLRKHPDFFTTVTSKLYECTDCTFKTVIKSDFDKHLLLNHPELISDLKLCICTHCNATFKGKVSLDDHVVKKHPDFISSITSKLHECTKCTFKTTSKGSFGEHLVTHPEVASDLKHSTCIHCNVTFTNKFTLDNHVVRKHPEFITTVARKLHECTKCTYKTVRKRSLDKHLLNHPEIASNFKPKICIHCNATFKGKMSLDDHVVRKHPDFSTTVTSKLHKCTKCAFKTVKKGFFDKHLLKHLGFASDFKHITCVHCNAAFKSKATLDDHVVRRHPDFSTTVTSKHITCVHCNATFTSKMSLDDHVVRKHPDFISSVTSKLYECTKCTFKTVKKICFSRHLLKHPGHVSDFNHITCVHCNATFESKMSLDGHVVRKHPDFISSVTSKLYECTKCTFKTVQKSCFSRHLLKHPGLASDFKHITCVHCNATFKSKMSLDDHVVRKHPDFISSVTSKLYECTKCTFKTVKKSFFSRHLLKHSGLVSDFKLITCVHCNATFKSKMALDGHVVRKHPDFISSITSKLYECTKCTTFKTVKKSCFSRHLLKHPGLASDFKHITCVHCNATFKSKIVLDHHVLRKHPDFISSVTSKLHECTECAYKTVIKSYFDKHLLKHSDFAQHMRG
nr:unnamed protein product [Callosobruchus analis]